MIITRTPFRISLAGGGSDLPEYYRERGGAVVSFSIDKYIYLSMHPMFNAERTLLKYSRLEEVARVEDIRHRIVRQVFLDYAIKGVDFNSSADVPAGTGLGSSSAFTVGLARLCDAYVGQYHSQEDLAAYACEVEIEKLGEPIGKQDQYACACGGLNHIRFEPDGRVVVEKIFLENLPELESRLALFYTGLCRAAGDILKEQRENTRQEARRNILEKMVKLADGLKEELARGNLEAVGEALRAGWELKKEMASGITSPEIDAWHDAALKAGAVGGKLLGAGGGGFLLFYAPREKMAGVRQALSHLLEVKIHIDRQGSALIYYD